MGFFRARKYVQGTVTVLVAALGVFLVLGVYIVQELLAALFCLALCSLLLLSFASRLSCSIGSARF